MIEPLMYIGIGFLIAGLLVIGVIPLVHGRAVRLTARRLEALNPVSMTEIQAQKDQLRAEFAMSTRRLEMSVEQLKARSASQLAELGKKNEAISRLKFELGEKAAAVLALEAKEKQLADELETVGADRAAKAGALEEAQRALAAAQAELAELTANFHARSVAAESQHVELVAEHAQIEALKGQLDAYRIEVNELRERLNSREAQVDLLRQQLADERASAHDVERVENAVLREHINEVAAEIARLTAALEGADSPITSILERATAPASGTNGGGVRSSAPVEAEPKATLTDRIRALQGRVARAAQRSRA
jgi:chromosome segregation ATPase